MWKMFGGCIAQRREERELGCYRSESMYIMYNCDMYRCTMAREEVCCTGKRI